MSERSRVYYTIIFLQVSFEAIKHSMAGKEDDTSPCWLDSSLLMMLSRELHACHAQASGQPEIQRALESARYHCELLLAQCPGALTRQLCHHHLNAILLPLREAVARLASPPATATHAAAGFWQRLCLWRR